MVSPYLTVQEAADHLRLKKSTVYGLVHQRRLAGRKHGSRLVFSREDLDKWSKAQEVRPLPSDNFPYLENSGIRFKPNRGARTGSLKIEYDAKRKPSSTSKGSKDGQ